jgi:hypothetical protein
MIIENQNDFYLNWALQLLVDDDDDDDDDYYYFTGQNPIKRKEM